MDGVARCARYAFGPNRLHLCGPDANSEMLAYMDEGIRHAGFEYILSKFQTMYPYLCQIARSNGIHDPFDERVVEAYWIGNSLLQTVDKNTLHRHYIEDHRLKDRLHIRSFRVLEEKIGTGALPHHSFHVFNIWKHTGHAEDIHTIDSMDACKVSWGTVQKIDGPFLTVKTEPLIIVGNKLVLGDPIQKRIARRLSPDSSLDEIQVNDMVTMHWDVPCEIISKTQARQLKHYTFKSIQLANLYL